MVGNVVGSRKLVSFRVMVPLVSDFLSNHHLLLSLPIIVQRGEVYGDCRCSISTPLLSPKGET